MTASGSVINIDLAEGTELEWSYDPTGQRIVAIKAGGKPARGESHFARLRGAATVRMSTDEIMALTRGDVDE